MNKIIRRLTIVSAASIVISTLSSMFLASDADAIAGVISSIALATSLPFFALRRKGLVLHYQEAGVSAPLGMIQEYSARVRIMGCVRAVLYICALLALTIACALFLYSVFVNDPNGISISAFVVSAILGGGSAVIGSLIVTAIYDVAFPSDRIKMMTYPEQAAGLSSYADDASEVTP